jgi:hypothetical protein
MSTITVSIGRNVPRHLPLTAVEWRTFRNETLATVETFGEVHFFGEGTGVYQGSTEESFTVVGTVEDIAGIRRSLAILATFYRQDSIALTQGTTSFVEGAR